MKEYQNESIASDIQFDTRNVANDLLLADAVNEYRDEAEINDIPYQTICIISTTYNNEPAYVVVKKKYEKKHLRKQNEKDYYYYTIFQPYKIEVSAPALDGNVLTRELPVYPGSSL
jgi:nucleoid-associated protein YejK